MPYLRFWGKIGKLLIFFIFQNLYNLYRLHVSSIVINFLVKFELNRRNTTYEIIQWKDWLILLTIITNLNNMDKAATCTNYIRSSNNAPKKRLQSFLVNRNALVPSTETRLPQTHYSLKVKLMIQRICLCQLLRNIIQSKNNKTRTWNSHQQMSIRNCCVWRLTNSINILKL